MTCDSNRKKIANNLAASVDLGLHNWIKLDNGELIDRPRFLDIAIGNIKRLELSRKGKRFGIVLFEKLSISKMVKNHKLAGKILDATWDKILQMACL